MLQIGPEDPRELYLAALLAEADAYSRSLYPDESRNPADAAFLAGPGVQFLVARAGGAAVGCGALVLLGGGAGEVKRLVVRAAARGQGVGRALLAAIEAAAEREGLACLLLETGPRNEAALGLYRRSGYRERPPFGSHRANPHSVFMEKSLPPRPPAAPVVPGTGFEPVAP